MNGTIKLCLRDLGNLIVYFFLVPKTTLIILDKVGVFLSPLRAGGREPACVLDIGDDDDELIFLLLKFLLKALYKFIYKAYF